ncbi:hypothetical protein [Streptomyces sp. NPDC050528]|uniref:hypothetical protein n=1 Tax=unclassified Streptomyces TaxID=2593676 RepID=UPI0037BBE97E
MFSSTHITRRPVFRVFHPVLATAAAAAALALLTACGGGSGSGDGGGSKATRDEGVASIKSPSAESPSVSAGQSAAADAGEVRIRLDDTAAEINRKWAGWTHCLEQHGVPKDHKPVAGSPALKACESKTPLQPRELDPATNPRYGDGVRAMVKCMNGHGIKSLVKNGNWALVNNGDMERSDFDTYRVECQVKAFK